MADNGDKATKSTDESADTEAEESLAEESAGEESIEEESTGEESSDEELTEEGSSEEESAEEESDEDDPVSDEASHDGTDGAVDAEESELKSKDHQEEEPQDEEPELQRKTLEQRETILEVSGLRTYFYTKEGEVPAVDGVDFELGKGQTLGLVGESGSGKSVSALSALRLVPDPPGKIVDGEILFEGTDLTKLSESEMRKIRGNDISMIFQEPMTSLNPVYTVGDQIIEAITLHQDVEYAEARQNAIDMLRKVGIPAPEQRVDEYPHQMSGGMKQRVMIAMALACNPKLLIADEPTTALDVTIQAQILELLGELQEDLDMSILFITHDLGVVAETCDYVAVMYGGRVVEYGDVETIFENPSHPYTIGLFSSLPQIEVKHRKREDRLYVIPGMVPSPQDFPSGCRFRDRCEFATEQCAQLPPQEELAEPKHFSACWYAREVREGDKERTGPYPDEPTTSDAAE